MSDALPSVVVMGVSGSGKTTVGARLAEALGVPFVEGDDLHPAANKAKMAAGLPLDDDDRAPWLERVAEVAADGPVVVSCSALRRSYRDRIRRTAPDSFFLLLNADPTLLRARQANRRGHFMPASLMDSQLATLEPLEPDEPGVTLDVSADAETLVAEAVGAVRSR